jgi:serine/threonine-protein kinase HipA
MAPVQVWIDDHQLSSAPLLVGRLEASNSRGHQIVRFRYADPWLSEAGPGFPIDPELPLGPGDYFPGADRSLHGAFRDTSPDRWGRRLMDRREREQAGCEGRRPRSLSEWDTLLGVQDASRLGALRFQDPDAKRWLDDRIPGIPPISRLRELEAAAERLEADANAELDREIASLLQPGSSLGGARPKATFSDTDGTLWIAKFPSRDDRIDVGGAEFLLHELASACGIDVPPARLLALGVRGRTYCVQRFDRQGSRRRMYWSAMTLLGRTDGEGSSYLEIAEALQNHADVAFVERDLHQLYRRILFNILTGNRDDHLRNHGFLRAATGWTLAPAFDQNPELDRREHAIAIDASDPRPLPANLRATADLYRLTSHQAARIESGLRATLSTWPTLRTPSSASPLSSCRRGFDAR